MEGFLAEHECWRRVLRDLRVVHKHYLLGRRASEGPCSPSAVGGDRRSDCSFVEGLGSPRLSHGASQYYFLGHKPLPKPCDPDCLLVGGCQLSQRVPVHKFCAERIQIR